MTPAEAWHDLIEKDDRNSPEEYPNMALISFEELQVYMDSYGVSKAEFEITRKACRIYQEACEVWMQRALKAEANR